MLLLKAQLAVLITAASFNDATYLAKSAADKHKLIMQQVNADDVPNGWYNSLRQATILTESMEPTVDQVGDEMSHGLFGTRSKLIHSQGVVASVKLTNSKTHPFTGLFKKAEYGIVRLSFASKPDPKVKSTTPGMGLKFLRDGMDSASLVAMYSVEGQDSWNFFKNDFKNHIPAVTGNGLLPLASKFSTVTNFIQTVGLSDFAQYSQSGYKVQKPVFPFQLRFHPTGEISFSDEYSGTYYLD